MRRLLTPSVLSPALLLLCLLGLAEKPGFGAQAHRGQSEGTRKMVKILSDLRGGSPAQVPRAGIENSDKPAPHRNAEMPLEEIKIPVNLIPRTRGETVEEFWAQDLLYAGETREAIRVFEALLKKRPSDELKFHLGVAYLRLGEQENCIHHHNRASCVFPIVGTGRHSRIQGSENAVRIFGEILDKPQGGAGPAKLSASETVGNFALSTRWLLNVAEMTLGKYPNDVPKKHVLPEKAFQSDREFPQWIDGANEVNARIFGHSGGAAIDDFDNDGTFDLLISSAGPADQLRYFKGSRDSKKHFQLQEATDVAGLTGITDGRNLVTGDFNNDGCLDVYVARGASRGAKGNIPDSLLQGHCDGTFEDVTEQAGLLFYAPDFTAAWWDYDNDGWLDLLVPSEQDTPGGPEKIRLFRNQHDGTFKDVARQAGLQNQASVKGVTWADFDNDGKADLFISGGDESHLYHNEGPGPDGGWRFRDVTREAGLPARLGGRTAFFLDFDNDGFEDLFVAYGAGGDLTQTMSEVVESYLTGKGKKHPWFFRNNGNGTFKDVTEKVGLDKTMRVMGANFGDLDNDGYLDLFFGTGWNALHDLEPNRAFWNDRGNRFLDITTAGGFGNLQKGHGIAFADLEGNGQQDVFVQLGGSAPGDTYYSSLYRNPGNSNHWLKLKLKGTRTNRAAIGARIHVTFRETSASGESVVRMVHRTVNSGGNRGCNPLEQQIGLGKASVADKVEVFWPVSGKTQVLEHVKADQRLVIVE